MVGYPVCIAPLPNIVGEVCWDDELTNRSSQTMLPGCLCGRLTHCRTGTHGPFDAWSSRVADASGSAAGAELPFTSRTSDARSCVVAQRSSAGGWSKPRPHYLLAVTRQFWQRICWIIMAALCNRAGHYIFALWFLSSIYLSVCLSVCLSVYLSICLSVYLSIYLSYLSFFLA